MGNETGMAKEFLIEAVVDSLDAALAAEKPTRA